MSTIDTHLGTALPQPDGGSAPETSAWNRPTAACKDCARPPLRARGCSSTRSRTLRATLRRHVLLFLTALPIAVALLLGVFAVPQLVALLDAMGGWGLLEWACYGFAASSLPTAWLATGLWMHARAGGRAGQGLALATSVLVTPSIIASILALGGHLG